MDFITSWGLTVVTTFAGVASILGYIIYSEIVKYYEYTEDLVITKVEGKGYYIYQDSEDNEYITFNPLSPGKVTTTSVVGIESITAELNGQVVALSFDDKEMIRMLAGPNADFGVHKPTIEQVNSVLSTPIDRLVVENENFEIIVLV